MRFRESFVAMLWVCLACACSTPNAEAPEAGRMHTKASIGGHGPEAETDLNACKICHSPDLNGSDAVIGCVDCHGEGPPFTHHALPYAPPEIHGPVAASALITCRNCHGSPPNHFTGGIVADPEIFNTPSGTCATAECHPFAGAHPTNWQGTNDTTTDYLSTHRTAQNKATNCPICHDYISGRRAPEPKSPSCFSAGFTNGDGATTSCHPGGPGTAAHPLPYTAPEAHGASARDKMNECQSCHGTPGTVLFTGGIVPVSCAADACHPAAEAHPTNWQGSNDNTPAYRSSHRNATNRNTTCVICHDVTQGRIRPNPDAPSCYSSGFTNADGSSTQCHDEGPS